MGNFNMQTFLYFALATSLLKENQNVHKTNMENR